MATAYAISEQLTKKFESWLQEKLAANQDAAADTTFITNYIVNMLTEDETSDEDKCEAIRPLLEELNQEKPAENDKLLDDIISSWNQMKLDDESAQASGAIVDEKKSQESSSDATDTILSMINKHKTQLVTDVKKVDLQKESSSRGPEYAAYPDEPSSDEERAGEGEDLFANTNSQDAAARERMGRDKLAENYKKQKEQTLKAAAEQKQKEVEKKKKAQAKVAKVERKR